MHFVLIIVGITSNDEYWICGIFAIGGALAFLFSGIKVYCDKERFFGKTSKENVEDNKVVAKQLPQHMVLNSFARNILNEMKVIIRESEKTLDKWNYLSCEEYLLNDFKKAFLKNPPYLKEGQKFVYRINCASMLYDRTFSLLCTGRFHIYLWELSPSDIGFGLKAVCEHCLDIAVEEKVITKEDKKRQLALLSKGIREVG